MFLSPLSRIYHLHDSNNNIQINVAKMLSKTVKKRFPFAGGGLTTEC